MAENTSKCVEFLALFNDITYSAIWALDTSKNAKNFFLINYRGALPGFYIEKYFLSKMAENIPKCAEFCALFNGTIFSAIWAIDNSKSPKNFFVIKDEKKFFFQKWLKIHQNA